MSCCYSGALHDRSFAAYRAASEALRVERAAAMAAVNQEAFAANREGIAVAIGAVEIASVICRKA